MLVCDGHGWRDCNVPMAAVAMSKSLLYAGGLMTGAAAMEATIGGITGTMAMLSGSGFGSIRPKSRYNYSNC